MKAFGKNDPQINKRIKGALLVSAVLFAVLVLRLFSLQLIQHGFFMDKANVSQISSLVIDAKRGTIYDRDMNVLAQSATVWNVIVDPSAVTDDNRIILAGGLSEILGISKETALECCTGSSKYCVVKRRIEEDTRDTLKAWLEEREIKSVWFEETTKRYYPYDNYLSSVLGFTGTDNYGLYGLEQMLDRTLSGTAGRNIYAKDAWGGSVYYEYESRYAPKEGQDVVLTIDETVQYYLEKYVEETMELYKVKNYAAGIVMNIKTGEILGITTKPDYNPNSPFTIYDPQKAAYVSSIADMDKRSEALGAAQQDQWTNKAVSTLYYPGSVFKAITAAMTLESGAFTERDRFVCRGTTDVAGVIIGCNNHTSHGEQSFAQTVVNSCNVAFMKMGEKMGAKTFHSYFKAFGLADRTGVDLPMEGLSLFYNESSLGPVELATSAFGQSNALTPIQVITAFGAVANGGYILEPHIISRIVDSNGEIVSENGTTIKRQVISEETSSKMAAILRTTATAYTAQNAYVRGYRVGGKSGTAEKQGGPTDEFIATFCAFSPAEDPEIAVLTLFDNPKGSSYYGGVVAGSCVGKIMSAILPHLGIDPVYTNEELETVDIAVLSVKGQGTDKANKILTNAGFSVKIIGDGSSVASQFPQAGMSAPKGATVYLYTDGADTQRQTVPDLTGYSFNQATAKLKACGLNIRISGSTSSSAIVTSQSVEKGTSVAMGTVITVYMTDYSIDD